jgi:phosphate transport system substrate-binding protein
MKKLMIVALMVALVPFAAFAGGQQDQGEDQLSGSVKIAGSSTVYPVSTAMAEEFYKMHPKVEIPVQSTGTGGGFKNYFIPGKTDINDASRTIKESEMASAKENGITPLRFQVAIDAITIVVHKDFPAENITVEELKQIWRPENPAQKWSDVRPEWPDEEIELYGPTSASGTFDYFTEEIIGEGGASRSDYQGTEQDNTIVQAISGSKYATGYFGMAYYLENKDKVKALKVNGVMPSIETAKSGEYTPLSRPLFIYVAKESLTKPQVREFVRFYLKNTDSDIIKQIGYVPMTSEDSQAMLDKLEQAIADVTE